MTPMSVTTHNSEAAMPPPAGLDRYIAVRPGYSGGKPHIAGHRIKVQDVAICHERLGQSAAEIAATYSGLSLAEVHAALAYYHSHRAEIDADIQADEEFVAALRSASGPSLVDEKLRQLHAQNDSLPSG
jgi:uncharacterized protein (DUF433 family)